MSEFRMCSRNEDIDGVWPLESLFVACFGSGDSFWTGDGSVIDESRATGSPGSIEIACEFKSPFGLGLRPGQPPLGRKDSAGKRLPRPKPRAGEREEKPPVGPEETEGEERRKGVATPTGRESEGDGFKGEKIVSVNFLSSFQIKFIVNDGSSGGQDRYHRIHFPVIKIHQYSFS